MVVRVTNNSKYRIDIKHNQVNLGTSISNQAFALLPVVDLEGTTMYAIIDK